MPGMTDRDHFAVAALTGFASQLRCGSVFNLTLTAKQCYELADAMLRERARTNLDAAPAARAPEPEPEPAARRRPAGGTGDTVHGASPEARASVGRPRTDNADLPTRAGTGDTPKPINGPDLDSRVWETPLHTPPTHATPGEGSERREGAEPVAYGVLRVGGRWVSILDNAVQAETSRQSFDRMENWVHEVVPLYRQPQCPVCLAARSGQNFSQQNLTLTDAERDDLACAESRLRSDPNGPRDLQVADTLRGLLERIGGGR